MKYQDLYDILQPPDGYPLERVLDRVIKRSQYVRAFEDHELGTLHDLSAKELRAEISNIIQVTESTADLIEKKHFYVFNLLYEGLDICQSDTTIDLCDLVFSEIEGTVKVLRDIAAAAKSWGTRGKGRPGRSANWVLVEDLMVLYEKLTGKPARTNMAFLDFAERCFAHAGIKFARDDRRATLKGLVNAANKDREKIFEAESIKRRLEIG